MKRVWFILASSDEYKNIEAEFDKMKKEGNPIERVDTPTLGISDISGVNDLSVKVYLFKSTDEEYNRICSAAKFGTKQMHW